MSVPAEKEKAGAHRKGGLELTWAQRQERCVVGTRGSSLWKDARYRIQYRLCSAELQVISLCLSGLRFCVGTAIWVFHRIGSVVAFFLLCHFLICCCACLCVRVRDLFNFIQIAWLMSKRWVYPTMVCNKVGSVCVCVCGWINPLLQQPHLQEEKPALMRACLSLYAHTFFALSSFCLRMFGFWLDYSPYCLDCDKMWATTTVVWYYIVAHCGLSGHLWHYKYVKYVGVWSFSSLSFFPNLFSFVPFILC